MGVQVVTDYSCGLADGAHGVRVVGPDPAKRAFGDPPSRQDYLTAFLDLVPVSETPLLCLVGPYGYSAAFTAAAAARNELGRSKIDPNRVHVVNAGRSFLGLGALAVAIAESGLSPDAALRWLDDAAPATALWAVAETARLEHATAEWQVEAAGALPDDEWTLLRIRLASRVMGGFDSLETACAAADSKAGASGVRLAWHHGEAGPAAMPPFVAGALGLRYAVATAPNFARSGTDA